MHKQVYWILTNLRRFQPLKVSTFKYQLLAIAGLQHLNFDTYLYIANGVYDGNLSSPLLEKVNLRISGLICTIQSRLTVMSRRAKKKQAYATNE